MIAKTSSSSSSSASTEFSDEFVSSQGHQVVFVESILQELKRGPDSFDRSKLKLATLSQLYIHTFIHIW